ncbi:MAG: glycosyltransferase family 8 protein [Clostridia bacterium]|nr:glycosyltransferase family 8 protein [Clostridia bacterium]
MNKKDNEIPVFFAVDDCYIPFLAVTIESLIKHTSKNNNYALKILFTSITKENQEKIKKFEKENISIEFVDLTEYIEKFQNKFYTRDYFSQTTYFRLFIPDIYLEYDKVLYIDSDTILLHDVADLYNIDLGTNLVGATTDGAVSSIRELRDYVELVVGLANFKDYFNAGVLLMNLEELRNFRFKSKVLYLLDTVKFRVAQDQDYLNRLCKGRVKNIDSSWNVMPAANSENRSKEVKLVHFNLNKPWHLDNILYEEYFWEYAKNTEFYDTIFKIKSEFSETQKQADIQTYLRLIDLAQKEVDCVGDDRKNRG